MNESLHTKLISFDALEREAALKEFFSNKEFPASDTGRINLHLHSFFSYNAEGWSPTRLAVEGKELGLYAVGLVDFDVLEGLEEFYEACAFLKIRPSVALETRTFSKTFGDKVIDSPGEPGVSYVCAAGFPKAPDVGTPENGFLLGLSDTASQRNEALVQRINEGLSEISISYADDVLPLSPGSSPTERHIVEAYIQKSAEVFSNEKDLAGFWQNVLEVEGNCIGELISDHAKFRDEVRAKLAKRGGIGYTQPDEKTFPPIESFFAWAKQSGAIPMESWLDGTSEGESDALSYLETSKDLGAEALNIIPDRNWNISDAETKAIKLKNLGDILKAAASLDFPVQIGTEMNKVGQPPYDPILTSDLKPYHQQFLEGAQIITGHVLLSRYADFSYSGEKAAEKFGEDIKEKNLFFKQVGELSPLGLKESRALKEVGPEDAYTIINDSVSQGSWNMKGIEKV